MSKIYETTNYSQFRFIDRNRDINESYVLESIKQKNMLASHPIIVTSNMEVLDGQNRLKAAERLGVPIYYIIDDTCTEEDIPRCQIQRTWQLEDYLKFYKNRIEDYKFIDEIRELYKIPTYFIIQCCSANKKRYQAFRDGNLTIKIDKDKLAKMFENFNELVKFISKIINEQHPTKAAMTAVWQVVSQDDYDHESMMSKCDKRRDKVMHAFKFKSVPNILENLMLIYNLWNRKEEKVA